MVEFGVTNNYENFLYDVFFFEVDEDGTSPDLECYKAEVNDMKRWDELDITHMESWKERCTYDTNKTTILTGQSSTVKQIKTVEHSNDRDVVVVIDNTILPIGGSHAKDNIVLEYSVTSKFEMPYNLRNVSIVMGIVSMIVIFAIGSLLYLSFKVKGDIARKFGKYDLGDDEEEDEDIDEDKKEES